LTQRLLAFSRRQPLDPKPLDINRLIAGMSELLRRTLGEEIEAETVLAGGLWTVLVDANQLEHSLLNLAINARDAMGGPGRLTIETANTFLDEPYAAAYDDVTPGQYVVISVTDTGSGMTREVREKAFEPFFTTKETGQGTGLGLSQVYGFIKQSGGHCTIYSEPGEGTTIKLYLPRHLGSEETVAPAAPAAASSKSPRINPRLIGHPLSSRGTPGRAVPPKEPADQLGQDVSYQIMARGLPADTLSGVNSPRPECTCTASSPGPGGSRPRAQRGPTPPGNAGPSPSRYSRHPGACSRRCRPRPPAVRPAGRRGDTARSHPGTEARGRPPPESRVCHSDTFDRLALA
jgi:hypothetical protein